MKHATAAAALAIGLLGGAACKLVAAPIQCASDDDCARFDAQCDIGQGVCAPPDAESTQGTFTAPLDAGAKPAARPAPSTTPAPSPSVTAPVDAGTDGALQGLVATVQCGDTPCVAGKEVCCIGAAGPKCSAAADCADAPVACDDTADCAAGGSNNICCAFNDGANPPALLRSRCVPADQCDATGPQDQMCDLKLPASQCASATPGANAKCSSFNYANATYAFCTGP